MLPYGCAERFVAIIPALLLSCVWVVANGLFAVIIQLEVQGLESSSRFQSFFGAPTAFTDCRLVGINVWVQSRRPLAWVSLLAPLQLCVVLAERVFLVGCVEVVN